MQLKQLRERRDWPLILGSKNENNFFVSLGRDYKTEFAKFELKN